jgi:hypothetical protein
VVAFNESALLRVVRETHVHVDPKTEPEAHKGRGKITLGRTPDEAGIPVKRNLLGEALLLDYVRHRLQDRVSDEVAPDLGIEQEVPVSTVFRTSTAC